MSRFETLLEGYIQETLTEQELNELLLLVREDDTGLKAALLNDLQQQAFSGLLTNDQREEMYAVLQGRIRRNSRSLLIGMWPKLAAAAAILFLVTAGTWWLFFSSPSTPSEGSNGKQTVANDIAPGKYKALLTLADGSKVVLDSAATGKLVQQGSAEVLNKDGQLVYDSKSSSTGNEPIYNTLSTARGETYSLALVDGSRVWLNAASSIKFPVAFTGSERRVEITGEAYFEVAHKSNMPFIVKKGDVQVQVLGTHFNVNAYEDEDAIKVTLLEGSVKVKSEPGSPAGSSRGQQSEIIIKPGEQAVRTTNRKLQTTNNIDVDQVMAWKNGLFNFNNADLPTIMRQLERWYDIQVKYQGPVPVREFQGELQRNLNLSQVLRVLNQVEVNYKIEGRTLIVL